MIEYESVEVAQSLTPLETQQSYIHIPYFFISYVAANTTFCMYHSTFNFILLTATKLRRVE